MNSKSKNKNSTYSHNNTRLLKSENTSHTLMPNVIIGQNCIEFKNEHLPLSEYSSDNDQGIGSCKNLNQIQKCILNWFQFELYLNESNCGTCHWQRDGILSSDSPKCNTLVLRGGRNSKPVDNIELNQGGRDLSIKGISGDMEKNWDRLKDNDQGEGRDDDIEQDGREMLLNLNKNKESESKINLNCINGDCDNIIDSDLEKDLDDNIQSSLENLINKKDEDFKESNSQNTNFNKFIDDQVSKIKNDRQIFSNNNYSSNLFNDNSKTDFTDIKFDTTPLKAPICYSVSQDEIFERVCNQLSNEDMCRDYSHEYKSGDCQSVGYNFKCVTESDSHFQVTEDKLGLCEDLGFEIYDISSLLIEKLKNVGI